MKKAKSSSLRLTLREGCRRIGLIIIWMRLYLLFHDIKEFIWILGLMGIVLIPRRFSTLDSKQ